MTKKTKVHLYTLVAKYLELDEKEVKEKLRPLKEELVNTIASQQTFTIDGILNITPERLPPGVFLNTYTKQPTKVPARIKPKVKLHLRFNLAVKDKKLSKINYF